MAERNVSPAAWASLTQVRVQLSITYSDAQGSQVYNAPDITNTYTARKIETIDLANGFNAVTVPNATKTTGVIIVPPDGNTATLKLKGVTGDTGLGSTILGYHVVMFDPATLPATIGLTCSAAIAGTTFYWF